MAITLVAHTAANLGATGGTTSGIDSTGSDLIVIGVSYYGSIALSVSDSKGNTWNALTAGGGSGVKTKMYYAKSPTVGTGHTFTITGGDGVTTGFIAAFIATFYGSDLSSPFDQQNGSGGSSGGTIQPGSVTPAENNELLVTVPCYYTSSGAPTVDGGFTVLDSIPYTGAQCLAGALAYLVQTSAASANPTWTLNLSSTECCASIATFKAGGGGGALPKIIQTLQAPMRASFF